MWKPIAIVPEKISALNVRRKIYTVGQSNQGLFEGLEEKKFFLFAFPP
jgi:hypothetical protein